MKAAVVHEPLSKDNLKYEEITLKDPTEGEIRVKLTTAGVNPIDYMAVAGKVVYNLGPIPHTPGTEVLGVAQTSGSEIRKGDRVLVYPRLFCGACDQCRNSREYLCRNGGLWGVSSNGGYSEAFNIWEKNLVKVPDGIPDDVAVSLPVGGLTAYHALNRAQASDEKSILIYGASGNTGIFASQIAAHMGMEVHAVSRKGWMAEYGADHVYEPGNVPEGLKVDIVLNSIGQKFWEESIGHLNTGGTLVTFGIQTGRDAKLDIASLYTGEKNIVGSTGGNRKEFHDLVNLLSRREMKVRVAARYPLSEIRKAMEHFEQVRDGRILIDSP